MEPNCHDEFIHGYSFTDVQPVHFVETRMMTVLKISNRKAVQFRYVLSRRREQSLAFDKHTSGMSVKKNIINSNGAFTFFFFRLQKAAKNCIFIDYSTQFVRQTELSSLSQNLLNIKIVQRSSVSGLKSSVPVSICWSQISVLREIEATLGGGHWGGSSCWLGNAWGRISCRNWREYTCRERESETWE